MTGAPDLADTIAAVVGALRRRHLDYFVGGSVASSVHGEFRATNDVDLVVALAEADIAPRIADLDRLIAKLRWYALGDEASESQRRDIRALIALNRSTLDLAYVQRWAAELGVAKLAARFLGEA